MTANNTVMRSNAVRDTPLLIDAAIVPYHLTAIDTRTNQPTDRHFRGHAYPVVFGRHKMLCFHMPLPDPVKLSRALHPPKSLREFIRHFSTEADCEEFLFLVRYPEGFVGPICTVERGWSLDGKRIIECTNGHKVIDARHQDLLSWFCAPC